MELKAINRKIYSELDQKKKEVDMKRENVDRLLLFYENLKYKQSYLRRQIKICKDLSTPKLNSIEKDIDQVIGATTFSTMEELQIQHDRAQELLEAEADKRKKMQSVQVDLQCKHQAIVEKVDKKRKFLEELPTRVATVKAATADLQHQFSTAMQEL